MQILNDNVCTDEFMLGFLEQVIPAGNRPVLFGEDASYFYCPKFQSANAQRRTYCSYKGHCLKYGFIVNIFTGKVVHYTPQSGSMSPGCGRFTL